MRKTQHGPPPHRSVPPRSAPPMLGYRKLYYCVVVCIRSFVDRRGPVRAFTHHKSGMPSCRVVPARVVSDLVSFRVGSCRVGLSFVSCGSCHAVRFFFFCAMRFVSCGSGSFFAGPGPAEGGRPIRIFPGGSPESLHPRWEDAGEFPGRAPGLNLVASRRKGDKVVCFGDCF